MLYAICQYKRSEMLKEILLSGKYKIGNIEESDNKMEEENNNEDNDKKKIDEEKEKKENSFEYIIDKAIDLCIQSKNYECLELILSNKIGDLMKYQHILKIYQMNLQNEEYIKNKINSYPKDELLRIYNEDKEFKIVLSATINGYKSLKVLLDSGYKLDQHNIFYQTICKYLYNHENKESLEDTFLQLLQRYKDENMFDLLINEEDINGDVLFDTIVNNSVKDVKKMSSAIYNKIETKEIVPIKRSIIPDEIVRSLNEEQNKRKRDYDDSNQLSKRGRYNRNMFEQPECDEDGDSDDDDDGDDYGEKFNQMMKNRNTIKIEFNVVKG